jgi:hypothetical protein
VEALGNRAAFFGPRAPRLGLGLIEVTHQTHANREL